MKKFLLSFFMLTAVVGLSAQSNLISNGDFEEWNFMSGTPEKWSINPSAWTNKSTDAQSGSYSVELESTDNGVGYISTEKFNIEAGKTYACSFYYKIGTGSLDKFDATLRHFDGIFPEAIVTKEVAYPVTGWTKYEFTYTAESSKNVDLQFLFWTDDKAKVLIDNVIFVEDTSNGISENSVSSAFVIYADHVVVNTGQAEVVSIYNTSGVLLSKEYVNDGGQLNISKLPTGVYVISIEGKSISTKFSKK